MVPYTRGVSARERQPRRSGPHPVPPNSHHSARTHRGGIGSGLMVRRTSRSLRLTLVPYRYDRVRAFSPCSTQQERNSQFITLTDCFSSNPARFRSIKPLFRSKRLTTKSPLPFGGYERLCGGRGVFLHMLRCGSLGQHEYHGLPSVKLASRGLVYLRLALSGPFGLLPRFSRCIIHTICSLFLIGCNNRRGTSGNVRLCMRHSHEPTSTGLVFGLIWTLLHLKTTSRPTGLRTEC